jgi:peptidyl-prolyl cis-trans isomerase C
VRARIADYLADTVWRRAIGQYVRILAGRARIDGIDIVGAATPLVQ